MKKIAVAAFVKTPGYSPIKTRLAKVIGEEKANKLFLLFCKYTAETIDELSEVVTKENIQIDFFWAVAEKEAVNESLWSSRQVVCQGEGTLGRRLFTVYDLLVQNHDVVLLIGGDAPHIEAERYKTVIDKLCEEDFVFGPAKDGGFYVLGGKKPIGEEIFCSVEYSRSDTLNELASRLRPIGSVGLVNEDFDVDDVATLEELRSLLSGDEGEMRKNLLKEIKIWCHPS